jgi:hypothetical protein
VLLRLFVELTHLMASKWSSSYRVLDRLLVLLDFLGHCLLLLLGCLFLWVLLKNEWFLILVMLFLDDVWSFGLLLLFTR